MICEIARAKVNLSLEVISVRQDGYHELRSLMHETELYDLVWVEAADEITVECSQELPKHNTAYRAVELYSRACDRKLGAHITIQKHIPFQAGLGGASADAAAVLRALQQIYGFLDDDKVKSTAKAIGADVPFCLEGGAAIATGIGEILSPLPRAKLNIEIAKPERGISTPELFALYDLRGEAHKSFDFDALLDAYVNGDAMGIASHLYNELEPAALSLCPEIEHKKRSLMQRGALGACMTGSGSAVFGIMP